MRFANHGILFLVIFYTASQLVLFNINVLILTYSCIEYTQYHIVS